MIIINEMVFSRSKAIEKIENVSIVIFDHLIKCFIYKDTTNDLQHWIHDEIVPQFEYISRINVKSGFLKGKDYIKAIKSSAGEDVNDFEAELYGFKARNRKYKSFDITPELVSLLYNKYNSIINKCVEAIINKEHNFEEIIYESLD